MNYSVFGEPYIPMLVVTKKSSSKVCGIHFKIARESWIIVPLLFNIVSRKLLNNRNDIVTSNAMSSRLFRNSKAIGSEYLDNLEFSFFITGSIY